MTKQTKNNTPSALRKRRLAALVSADRYGAEKCDTLSYHARRCTAASMAQDLKHYV